MGKFKSFKVGHIYFGISYEDDLLTYPIIDSYEYLGSSDEQEATHLFRILGTDDELALTDEQLAIISNATEFAINLNLWAKSHPSLS